MGSSILFTYLVTRFVGMGLGCVIMPALARSRRPRGMSQPISFSLTRFSRGGIMGLMQKVHSGGNAAQGQFAAGLIVLISLFLAAENVTAQSPGTKRWYVETGAQIISSPALGPDGAIYVGSGTVSGSGSGTPGALYSISPSGTTNWIFRPSTVVSASPAIGPDGTVYVPCANGKLYALAADGTTNWILSMRGKFLSSPAIGGDGTIYVGSLSNYFNKLYAVRPDGATNWVFSMGGVSMPSGTPPSVQLSSPAIGRDGTIYVGSPDGHVYAISPTGTTNWVATLGAGTYSSPAIGPDGTIYVGADDHVVYAIDRLGKRKWTFPTGSYVESSAAISPDGSTIYIGSVDGIMYALSPAGAKRWTVNASTISSSPAVGADGSICFAAMSTSQVYAVSSNGVVQWTFSAAGYAFSSPVIGPDGTIYLGAGTKLHALYGTNSPASSSWPMFRRDPRHHARSVQCALGPPAPLPDGNFTLTLSVETDRTYQVQASTNLFDWTELASFSSSSVSTQFADLTATNSARRYYRLLAP